MRDCDNLEVRERLPDLLHGTLADAARAEAEDHVASCADCAAELALLRSVRDGIAHAPGVDVDRIVAAIPPYRRSPRRDVRALSWRVAAALVFVAAGATLWSSAARSTRQPAVPSAAPLVTGATAAAPVA
ncbi:MAG TPA: zf-HC2 domain-containing protein, partial [Gemmatimonadaceae bacterium]|nr:zf-HC2 domain-containing protein [Gemmatimonadaceae bacterium]